jgi:hypothetical protein
MSQAKPAAKSTKEVDAITLLTDDHKKVKKLFKDFEKLKQDEGSAKDKAALVNEICIELSVHAKVEEEIFYPAVREAIDDEDLMDEADVEHAGAKDLIAQLQSMKPGDDLYDAKVTVLGEYIDHHVKEEQEEMFAKAKKAKVDTAELGEQIAARKEELLADPSLLTEAA